MRIRTGSVALALLAAVVLASAMLGGCGKATAPASTTEVPADMKDTVAAAVFTKMAVKPGDSGDAVIAQFKAVTGADQSLAPGANVVLGVGSDGKTSSHTYTFSDKSTLELKYASTSGLPADNKFVGIQITKP